MSDFGLVQNSELSPAAHSANMIALAVDADGSRGRSSLTRPANSNEHAPQLPSGLNTTDLTDGSKTKKGDNSSDTSLKEDELRAKEKTLSSKERLLRDLQKKLNSKKINLGYTLDWVPKPSFHTWRTKLKSWKLITDFYGLKSCLFLKPHLPVQWIIIAREPRPPHSNNHTPPNIWYFRCLC